MSIPVAELDKGFLLEDAILRSKIVVFYDDDEEIQLHALHLGHEDGREIIGLPVRFEAVDGGVQISPYTHVPFFCIHTASIQMQMPSHGEMEYMYYEYLKRSRLEDVKALCDMFDRDFVMTVEHMNDRILSSRSYAKENPTYIKADNDIAELDSCSEEEPKEENGRNKRHLH